MRRYLLYAVISFCLLLATLFIFRTPLSIAVANHFLTQEQGRMSCLAWSPVGFTEIHISKVCFSNEQADVYGENITVTTKSVEIAHLKVKHKPIVSGSTPAVMTPLSLPLIADRPLVSIKKLHLESPVLRQPLSVSVHEAELNSFTLNGDILAQVLVYNDKVNLNADLQSQGIKPYLPSQLKALAGQLSATFDGIQADTSVSLDASILDRTLDECDITARVVGGLSGSWDLNARSGGADLSSLDIKLDALACDKLQRYQQSAPIGLLSTSWRVVLPKPLNISSNSAEIPALTLEDNNGATAINLKNLSLDVGEQVVQTDIQLSHHNPQLGWLELQSKLGIRNKTLSLEGDWLLSSEEVRLPQDLKVQDFVSQGDYVLKGEVGQTVSFDLATQSSMGKIANSQAQLDNTELNLTTHVNVDMKQLADGILQALQVDVFKTQFSAERYQVQDVSGKHVLLNSAVSFDEDKQFTGQLEFQVGSFKKAEVRGKDVTHTLTLNGEFKDNKVNAEVDGETHLGLVATPQLSFRQVVLTSAGLLAEQTSLEHVLHLDDFEMLVKQQVDQQLHHLTVMVPEQSFLTLKPILTQFEPKLQLSEGTISATLQGDVNEQSFTFNAALEEGGILYDSHYLSGLNIPVAGKINAGKIAFEDSQIDIREVRSGAVLENFKAILSSSEGDPMLSNISANIFDGQLFTKQIKLTNQDQSFLVEANNWDLAVIANAAKNAGVELSGRVHGQLPVAVVGGLFEINGGKLNNIDIGLLSIENNESVEALKAQQPSLETAFGMLERLNIEKLSSDVNMSSDGWLDLAVQITGVNEQQAEPQPINFNYTHKENIFQLFRALRLSDEITNEVEKALN
ncbi:YdbH domain-containing protein [Pseudoalteromonas luteoviolacea]|uniref:YdbH domain-containing protein n=1 Tax=Pseudoalteromonas luteoviolacea TaxID=43657 RepID=UPI001B3765EE|nr:YdbH domain-containing protein [Pseudoalteromonas luteoviolacea]MBQ4839123.1 YdbH domain-containing protein [Pseudoalteromonas luteoviolacea]